MHNKKLFVTFNEYACMCSLYFVLAVRERAHEVNFLVSWGSFHEAFETISGSFCQQQRFCLLLSCYKEKTLFFVTGLTLQTLQCKLCYPGGRKEISSSLKSYWKSPCLIVIVSTPSIYISDMLRVPMFALLELRFFCFVLRCICACAFLLCCLEVFKTNEAAMYLASYSHWSLEILSFSPLAVFLISILYNYVSFFLSVSLISSPSRPSSLLLTAFRTLPYMYVCESIHSLHVEGNRHFFSIHVHFFCSRTTVYSSLVMHGRN